MSGGKASGRARTFAAFPPSVGSRAKFAVSWWGQEWLDALEESSLDYGRLQRGRTYARRGAVGAVTVSPGRIAAPVQGSRRTPYRVSVAVTELTGAEWERLLDTIAERAGNIAALLDRDMPPELAEDAAAAGVPLLPGPGDLDPSCSCPDWGYPCKHGAALCYQAARLLDEDPFVLLLMRGRGEDELLDELQRRNAARAGAPPIDPAAAPAPPAGVSAAQVFAAARAGLPPLPEPPPLPESPGRPPVLPAAEALELLVADAAARARRLLADALADGHQDRLPEPPLTEWQDCVRLAAAHDDVELLARLASGVGRPAPELEAAARAWQYGGGAALEALEESWTPPPGRLERERDALREDWGGGALPRLRSWRNRWTVEGRGAQLRLGRDGRWYPYRKEGDSWWPCGPADSDVSVVLALLLDR